jgi:hypothetical protein
LLMSSTLESPSTHLPQLMPQPRLMPRLQLLLLPQLLTPQHQHPSTDLPQLLTGPLLTGPPSLAKQLIKHQRLFDFCDIIQLIFYFYLLKYKLQKTKFMCLLSVLLGIF